MCQPHQKDGRDWTPLGLAAPMLAADLHWRSKMMAPAMDPRKNENRKNDCSWDHCSRAQIASIKKTHKNSLLKENY